MKLFLDRVKFSMNHLQEAIASKKLDINIEYIFDIQVCLDSLEFLLYLHSRDIRNQENKPGNSKPDGDKPGHFSSD